MNDMHMKKIVFIVVIILAFVLLSDDVCPKCGGCWYIPQLTKCTNIQCRAGKVFVTKYKYDERKRRKVVVEVETRKCPCCGGMFDIPETNGVVRKIELKPGIMLVKLNLCDRCWNVQYGNAQFNEILPSPMKNLKFQENIEIKTMQPQSPRKCKACGGSGYKLQTCNMCRGKGQVHVLTDRGGSIHHWKNYDNHGRHKTRLSKCPKCNNGKIKTTCPICYCIGTIVQ